MVFYFDRIFIRAISDAAFFGGALLNGGLFGGVFFTEVHFGGILFDKSFVRLC